MSLTKYQWLYIGDGVYVMWNGYDITLATGSHTNPTNRIVLEPATFQSLLDVTEKIRKGEG